ncbi:RNA binding protein [Aspergillus bombycis]|uniref:RNA binding protein n=1 Tax=Aspergillus bombycis TaxID=109264 RepID=A0A1F8AEH6_9EURO|nr:RNA binding protein [Aspergillus bombycis]OGM50067.1 RNA binding protein [Aspergillus bombycis]
MPRANEPTAKVFYKGAAEDFIVFVDDIQVLNNWRKDRSIPLADVVNGFKIFVTHRHGAQGIMDGASKGILDTEFGTSNEDECIQKILENGEYQSSVTRERQDDTNVANGPVGIGR